MTIDKAFLTTTEVAARLRPSVSRETVRRMAADGRIPGAYQLVDGCSRWRIPAGWLEETLARLGGRRGVTGG